MDKEKHYGFLKKLEILINSTSQENGSNTPDFILAGFLSQCLRAFDEAVNARSKWYGNTTTKLNKRITK